MSEHRDIENSILDNIKANTDIMGEKGRVDAFDRLRISSPDTLFDSKQIFDNQPLFWDESLETGSGITSAHSVNEATTTITSTLNTAGKFTRQTFMRFNYQPGKSQFITMTGVLDKSGGGTGVQRRIGEFDDNNGFFFEDDEGTIKTVLRSKVTGSVVDDKVAQADWNLDKMDGTGVSGINMDFTKSHIWLFDYEWLGVGRSRFGMFHKGVIVYVHEYNNDNTVQTAYMSTPNLPLRYQMITTSSSPQSSMGAICASVISEGGRDSLGILRYASTAGDHVDADVQNITYAILGTRLKSTHLGATIEFENISVAEHQGSKEYEWSLILNPVVSGTFTYSDVTNSALQIAKGATANSVTPGTIIEGGYASSAQKGGITTNQSINNELRLGAKIDGTVDEIVLCVKPVGGSVTMDIEGAITWKELS